MKYSLSKIKAECAKSAYGNNCRECACTADECFEAFMETALKFYASSSASNAPDKKINSVTVIEDIQESVQWGISFTGHNPDPEDYFKMDEPTAFRLAEYLNKRGTTPSADPKGI